MMIVRLANRALLGAAAIVLSGCASASLRPPTAAPLSSCRPLAPVEAPVTITFMGTSTLVFTDGTTTIMTDGFFSRPSPLRMAMGPLRPDPDRIEKALMHVPDRIEAIFVAHSHFDHAMDTAYVAVRTGAHIYGSISTVSIVEAGGAVRSQRHEIMPRIPVRCGTFTVTGFASHHAPSRWARGSVNPPFRVPAWAWEYPEGGAFSFLIEHGEIAFLIVPSANFAEGPQGLRGVQADVVFLGLGSLGRQSAAFTEAYWREAVADRGASLVVPIHWDNLTRSLDEPLQAIPPPFDDMEKALGRLRALADDGVEIRLLQRHEVITVGGGSEGATEDPFRRLY